MHEQSLTAQPSRCCGVDASDACVFGSTPTCGGAPCNNIEKVYIPAMKQFVLEFKNLAGQQQGVASITTAREKQTGHAEAAFYGRHLRAGCLLSVCLCEMPCGSRPSKVRSRLCIAVLQLWLLMTCVRRGATRFACVFLPFSRCFFYVFVH